MTRRVSLEPEKSLGKVRNRVPAAARDDSEERNRLYCKVYVLLGYALYVSQPGCIVKA